MFTRHTLLRTAFTSALVLLGLTTVAHAATPANPDAQRYGVFAEPLIATGTPSSSEKFALTAAIDAYRQTTDIGHTVALEQFLAAHSGNPWRSSLWLDIGLADRTTGRFSAAIHAFAQARETALATHDAVLRPIAVRALSEQLMLETRLGHQQAVTDLLQSARRLGMSVQDSMAMSLAEDGLFDMQHHPQSAFQCGWIALRALWRMEGVTVNAEPSLPMDVSHPGYNLEQLMAMAKRVQQPVMAIHQDAATTIPVPSVVHWKSGHFATILARDKGRYKVADPTVEGGSSWMTADAVRDESSGYFLVPQGDVLANGERLVTASEAVNVRGAGLTSVNNPHGFPQVKRPQPCGCSVGSSNGAQGAGGNTGGNSFGAGSAPNPGAGAVPNPAPSNGMPTYSISPMLISLTLTDTPLSYTPPKGPAINITFSYNQLDIDQPTTFTFGNVGPLWTHNWLSYVEDNPTSPGSNVMVYMPGGPGRLYSGYNSSNGSFSPEAETGAQLVEVSSSPVVYERNFPDGSRDVYTNSDGSTSYPRHVFLTQRIDAHGNTVQLAYDNQNRLTTLTDAIGQVVTFGYDNASFPLQVTSVSDAFGRSTTLAYNSTGQLDSITDAIGMTSSFTYASGTSSITASTTPYGTTQFVTGQSGVQRWINITDVDGNVSRMEFNETSATCPTSPSPPPPCVPVPFSESQVPTGMTTYNQYIYDRNSYYWDAQAYKLDAGIYSDAVIYHWDHVAIDGQLENNPYTTSDSLESIKYPLENRIWYDHPNDTAGGSGSLNMPTNIGRVLSSGATQLTQNSYDAYGHLLSEADPSGLTTTYIYASNQIDVTAINRTTTSGYSTTESFTYDNQHDVLSHTDQTGAVTSYTYNAAGQMLTMTDALGHTTTYSYNPQGYLQSKTDANGNATTYTYDAVGRLASVTDPLNRTTSYSYDALNRLVQTTYPDSSTAVVSWNKLDIGSITDRNGHTTMFTYDGLRDLLTRTDPLGNTTTYTYYPNRLPASRTDANGHTTTWQRDLEGRVTSVTDPLNHTSSIAYDPDTDLRTSTTNALGQVTSYSYDTFDRLTASTDPNGVITNFTYSPQSWLASRIVRANANGSPSSSDATTTLSYDAIGDLTAVTDPDGVVTNYAYDPDHRPITTTDAVGNTQNSSYDAVGNITQNTRAVPNATTASWLQSFAYDAANEKTQLLDAYDQTTTQAFDVNGRLQNIRDPLGYHTVRSYDAVGNLLNTQQGATDTGQPIATTAYTYDQDNRLLTVTDPDQLTTSYSYDPVGQLLQLQSPDTGTTTKTYDAAGNLSSKTDARGVITQYSYDALNRLTGVSYPAQPSLNIAYTYDQASPISGCPTNYNIGHLTSMTDASGTTAWCYTNQGDIREVRQVINNAVYLHGYAYTSARRLRWLQYPSGFELLYSFDGDGRVSTIQYLQQPGPFGSYTNSTLTPLINSVSYLPFGPVTGYTFALGGQSATRTYDANYRLTDLVSTGLTLHFLLDAKGRISAEGNNPGANPSNETYQYDPLDRLTGFVDTDSAEQQSFGYSPAGDRVSEAFSDAIELNTYYPGTHRLEDGPSGTQTYDANGNTVSMYAPINGLIGLGYDDRNRLTTITSGGSTIANYQYNGEGQRVWRTITEPSAGQAATVYDPTNSGNLFGEYFAQNYREYVYLNGIPVASATDAGEAAPLMNYLYADHLGTLRAVVSSTATSPAYTWPWLDNAFGNQSPTGAGDFYLRFPGQYYDVETGLSFNNNRNYDPATGRYIQSDPIGLIGGIDTYAYVGGNPLDRIDPLGLYNMEDAAEDLNRWLGGWQPSQGTVDAVAGFGDGVSLSLSKIIRGKTGVDTVNYCDPIYGASKTGGHAYDIAFAGAFAAPILANAYSGIASLAPRAAAACQAVALCFSLVTVDPAAAAEGYQPISDVVEQLKAYEEVEEGVTTEGEGGSGAQEQFPTR